MPYWSEFDLERAFRHALLLGVGFDCEDGHRRITRGENFFLVGGSQRTHDEMTDKTLAFNEELKRRVKTLDELSPGEFYEIMRKVDEIR